MEKHITMSDSSIECKGCGAKIGPNDVSCPKCGQARISKVSTGTRAVRRGDERYRGDRGTVHFGDGEHERRPESGTGSIKEAYRRGGRSGNVQVCMKCKHVHTKIRDTCENCGSKLQK